MVGLDDFRWFFPTLMILFDSMMEETSGRSERV